ncbi:hypothetical protein TPHA_0E02110 [Tetrapisispora phaffii CBS 4417]|uniref:Dit2p n=1 Tax=Tetrapisispora phaffii (strain ATCC 24235 / CBS 4417 / NBRC 1672 / NRRL Y-8282 / UCD 70-5) TaxID=1071381 RepID=G8BTS5_TETPH|nr:hypothetical protein TPHA_0E02110 [Tetrapisispora phaffii CBS 4417]CCE63303.1 hypothetical protein TPHA_0E02110 [Tetrapisispora phaffii CBS 4417]
MIDHITGTATVLIASLIFLFLFKIYMPPLDFPRNIPTIPFYVQFLPTLFRIDQVDVYNMYIRESMEKYGAVKFFFGSRWNILVSKPEYLKQMFKNEDTFAKSGNQRKIPYSLIAAYTGDNVISAHGDNWKLYRSSITNGLQHYDGTPMVSNAILFCSLIKKSINSTEGTVTVGPLIQKLTLANISQIVLGFDFGTLSKEHSTIHDNLLKNKKKIFNPLFLTFPFLDLLNLPQRKTGFQEVNKFREELVATVEQELINNYKFEQTTFAASDLIRAYNNEQLNFKQLADNLTILLVAGHENPQLALTSIFYYFGKYADTWQKRIREEVSKVSEINELYNLPLLNAFIYETLRILPPLNIIINRCTTETSQLGPNIVIPKNTYVGYHNFGTTHDKNVWGLRCEEFDPYRWGCDILEIKTNWKHAKNLCKLPTFHGGKRACLGEKFANQELIITLAESLKRFEWVINNDCSQKMTPGGPLCPADLKLKFKCLDKD